MEKLELIHQFRARFGEKLAHDLCSIKYCQSLEKALVELSFFHDRPVEVIDLAVITNNEVLDCLGNALYALPYFDPLGDIVDNATLLVELDEYSLIMIIDHTLNEDAIEEILEKEGYRKLQAS